LKIKSEKDFWSGIMFVVVGLAFAWGATNYNFGSSARPGPAYFPFGLGLVMAALGVAVLFKALTVETADGDKIGAWAWRPLLLIVGSVVVFGLAVPKLGLVVALPLLVLVCSLASEEFKWIEVALNAAVLTLMSWAIFIKGLGLTIPLLPAFLSA
jgi:hypothetical protein